MPDRTPSDNETERAPVNPAERGDAANDKGADPGDEIVSDRSRSASHNKQSEQNQDQNSQYDPTLGRRHDQLRRNDKQGQMGG